MPVIIIESPNKVKKIKQYSKMTVLATVGHFKDLPVKKMGVDLDTYEPEFVVNSAKKKTVSTIKKACKDEIVYIATDPDREGFAIGMHIYETVKKIAKEIYRIEIREITKNGVQKALKGAVPFEETNFGVYNAFLSRRIGGRLIAYILSPIASREMHNKFSVGRVQSPAVKLLVEKEREIKNFKPEKYHIISIALEKENINFEAFYKKGRITDKSLAKEIFEKIQIEKHAKIEKIEKKKKKQNPKPPFTTVDLQANASSVLRMSPEKSMKIAQGLFESGLITYHRTDSVRIAPEFIEELRNFTKNKYGEQYIPAKPIYYKSKASQAEAHEAIRPTSIHSIEEAEAKVRAEGLESEHEKLYKLICKRTFSSQMSSAIFDATAVDFNCANYTFRATGQILVFDGFLKVYKELTLSKKSEDEKNQNLPNLKENELVNKTGEKLEEKETKPPARYSEGTLVKKLESLGIGRPSTYASIIALIKKRGYAEIKKQRLFATKLGDDLVSYLDKRYDWITDYKMTGDMEQYLDEVEQNKGEWKTFVQKLHEKTGYWKTGSKMSSGVPTDRQINYAKSLSQKTGIELSQETLESSKELSKWIKELKKTHKFAPSEKQIAFAKQLSEEHNISLDEETLSDATLISKWINSALKEAKSKMPLKLSPKQLAVIEKNADEETKKAVKEGDLQRGKDFIDNFFKELKKNKKAKKNSKTKTTKKEPKVKK
jgi:DNA topoisomerase-1